VSRGRVGGRRGARRRRILLIERGIEGRLGMGRRGGKK